MYVPPALALDPLAVVCASGTSLLSLDAREPHLEGMLLLCNGTYQCLRMLAC